jgi:putative PIG3 family NAD(P)H quinone oxidoreductase
MRAIEITEPGGPEVLVATERTVPEPKAGEVLVRVAAAGVNRPDVMQRTGMYPPPPGASDIPGLEIAGEIVAVGEGVEESRLGERICALVTGGGYADYCIAAAALCLPIPKGLDALQAAALPETFFTVWTNVFDRGHLTAGEFMLVHGGSSGIGTTAIQLGKAFGAKVLVTAGSAEKCAFCEELGAHGAINYREEDYVERVKALTGDHGADLILCMIGGEYFPRNVECLAVEGRLVQIALQQGPKTKVNLLPIMMRRLVITGSTLRPRTVEQKATIAASLKRKVWALLESGAVAPVVHAEFPLERASDAHALMESSAHMGKILLRVEGI